MTKEIQKITQYKEQAHKDLQSKWLRIIKPKEDLKEVIAS